MANVYDIRYRNLRELINANGGENGGITRVAEILGKSQGQISHIGGKKPIKNIGHKLAREIEAKFGMMDGGLDAISLAPVLGPRRKLCCRRRGRLSLRDSLGGGWPSR